MDSVFQFNEVSPASQFPENINENKNKTQVKNQESKNPVETEIIKINHKNDEFFHIITKKKFLIKF